MPPVLTAFFLIEGLFLLGFVLILAIHRLKKTPPDSRRHLWTKYGWYVVIVNGFLLGIFTGPPWFPLLMGLVVFQGFREFFTALAHKGVNVPAGFGTGLGLLIYMSAFGLSPAAFWVAATAALLLSLLVPVFSGNPEAALEKSGALFLALFLLGILGSLPLLILNLPKGNLSLGFLYTLVALNDGFSELFGRGWGKRPLIPAISPQKTVGGALGGFCSTLAGSLLFSFLLAPLPWYCGALAGTLVGLAAQLGDLLFSALKRDLGVKDYGSLIPGHGGVLDRFDSFLVAAPVFYGFLLWAS